MVESGVVESGVAAAGCAAAQPAGLPEECSARGVLAPGSLARPAQQRTGRTPWFRKYIPRLRRHFPQQRNRRTTRCANCSGHRTPPRILPHHRSRPRELRPTIRAAVQTIPFCPPSNRLLTFFLTKAYLHLKMSSTPARIRLSVLESFHRSEPIRNEPIVGLGTAFGATETETRNARSNAALASPSSYDPSSVDISRRVPIAGSALTGSPGIS